MAAKLLTSLLLLVGVIADPTPGRIPKVYNALITSNQNLEPSKAYPVYQPVLHDPFGFSYQPAIFYGGNLIGGGLPAVPPAALVPKAPQSPETKPSTESLQEATAPTESSPTTDSEPAKSDSEPGNSTPAPPPPTTESPIPLNEFGLPPQVLPLGHLDPSFNALPQFNPFTYRYPGVRFYDPYDPFSFSPYAGLPVYRPLPNLLTPNFSPVLTEKEAPAPTPAPSENSAPTPPPEPSDLNILNYSSKDPAIPNVPPPPLPHGGLKSDKSE